MKKQQQKITHHKLFLSIVLALTAASVLAESDKEIQDRVLRAREMTLHGEHHQGLDSNASQGPDFRGVYYGYYPCHEADCSGIKKTLSLKRNNNYLLVTQPAKPSSREFYEKGKFTWNENTRTVTLTPRDNAPIGQLRIVDDATLIQLNPDGSQMAGDQDDYTLKRGDTMNSREVHIH